MIKKYRYLEDLSFADAAFEAEGDTLEELFIQAADALVNLMVEDPRSIEPKSVIRVEVKSDFDSLDLDRADALRELLEKIIYWKDVDRLVLRARNVRLVAGPAGNGIVMSAELAGEAIDPHRHALGTDVKAVTFHHLRVWKEAGRWKAVVVVDM